MATTNNLNMIIVFISTILALAVAARGRTFTVGGDAGWRYGFDHLNHIKDYDLIIGDKLLFKYPPGKHDVVEVSTENYVKCTVPPGAKVLTSGSDIIEFKEAGRRNFICSKDNGRHCREGNMKVYYNVPETYASSRKLVAEKV
ncbi:cupredoxin [Artemisia annua]|uniref:Cupredoxin n=1 Tax=Artemisia annua TaxID=35608 RepID=A0A2U1KTW3_ARTAN|nr:cupredoxin [Artemisia annua]